MMASIFFGAVSARAQSFEVPPLTGPVVDRAGLISAEAERLVSNYVRSIRERGGAQVQVLILPSLGGLTVEEASIKVVDEWKLGDAKTDRGVLLLLALQERKIRLEVGQGVEGEIPDAYAKRIVSDVISPRLRAGKPDEAIFAGVRAITSLTDPKLADVSRNENLYVKKRVREKEDTSVADIFVFIIVLIMVIIFNFRRGGGGLGGLIAAGGLSGGWSRGGGGGWSGGGGGFSGGGASGDW